MRRSRLDRPDLAPDHWEHAHSPTFAVILQRAYVHMADRDFTGAEQLVAPCRLWPIAMSQRLRQLFILATAAHQRGDFSRSIAYLEEAMALSMCLEAPAEYAQLSLLCAEAHHSLQAFDDAAKVAGLGLDAWLDLGPGSDPADLSLEIDLRDRYSIELFLLGRYEQALGQCYAAQILIHSQPMSRQTALRAAAVDWTLALLHRWRGNYQLAERHVLTSAPIYERWGSLEELARLRIVAADISLDMMVPMGGGSADHFRADLIPRTQVSLTQAVAAASSDPAARGMAILAQTRLSRALALGEDRLARIESIGKLAEQLQDLPLLTQVYTTLGDEFGASGTSETESQRNCYRRALGVAESCGVGAYGVWARRGLLRHEESRKYASGG
jgi:tetratricopeptide (TPR) repeat protein